MKQEPVVEQLLPLSPRRCRLRSRGLSAAGTTSMSRMRPVIDELLLPRYVEALVYQAVAENMASEQSARMVAMKAATDNAGNLIGELKLVYNKTRQAAITKELSRSSGRGQRSDLAAAEPTKNQTNWSKKWSRQGKIVQGVSAPWWTWEFPRDQMPKI